MWGEPAGKDLYFIASMTDYYYLETLTSTAVTHVFQDGIKLKVLGRNIRTFKPAIPFNIQVCFIGFSCRIGRVTSSKLKGTRKNLFIAVNRFILCGNEI